MTLAVEDTDAAVYNSTMTIKLPDTFEERLRDLARMQKRDVSALVEDALRQYMETAEGPAQRESNGKAATKSTSRAPAFRQRELEWRRTHENVLRQYEDKWVALEIDEIVAHGVDLAEVIREARGKGISRPYVFFVEKRDPDRLFLGL